MLGGMTALDQEPRMLEERPPLPLWWRAAVWAVSAAWVVLQIPFAYGLQPYIYFDSGWALSTDELLSEGLIPTQDFAYFYGLLVLVVDRAWFALFGATPAAQAGLSLLCTAASTHAVIRFARAMRLGRAGRSLLLAASPLAIMPSFFPTPAHALEHALLINAIASQAAGRRAGALVLATTALFVKPTMAAIYGPILIVIILCGPRPTPSVRLSRLRDLAPATVALVAIAGLLAARFGIEPLIATLIPLDGMRLYAAHDYGFFFGAGRHFWLPEPLTWWYYPFMPAGFWLIGTAILAIGAATVARRGHGPNAGVTLTCIALHFAFIFFLFGNDMSWKYYPYLLVFGLCGIVDGSGTGAKRPLAVGLAIAAIMGQSRFALVCLAMMLQAALSPTPVRSPATAGLLASVEDQRSWGHVRQVAATQRVMLLSPVGAGHILMPEVDSPRAWFLLHPIAKPAEVASVNGQIHAADWLVIPTGPGERLDNWPEFGEALGCFRIVEIHPTFVLAKRFKPPPSSQH